MLSPREFVGEVVVVDIVAPYVYLGKLAEFDDHHLILVDADVHDLRDTNTSRENYVVDSRRLGVRPNRARVYLRLDQVVSLSRLSDVLI